MNNGIAAVYILCGANIRFSFRQVCPQFPRVMTGSIKLCADIRSLGFSLGEIRHMLFYVSLGFLV